MTLRKFLSKVNTYKLAEALDITPQAVSQWKLLKSMPNYVNMEILVRLSGNKISRVSSRNEFLEKREKEIEQGVKAAKRNLGRKGIKSIYIR